MGIFNRSSRDMERRGNLVHFTDLLKRRKGKDRELLTAWMDLTLTEREVFRTSYHLTSEELRGYLGGLIRGSEKESEPTCLTRYN